MEQYRFVASAAGEILAVHQSLQLAGIPHDVAAADEYCYGVGSAADHANFGPTPLEAHWQQK